MQAVILAAGRGTRLGSLAQGRPKGLLEFHGSSLIEQALMTYRGLGIEDCIIVTGFGRENFHIEGVRYCHNPNYMNTNMVESLYMTAPLISDDVVVSYSDILFSPVILKGLLNRNDDIVVTVDLAWEKYWLARYDSLTYDTESLIMDADGRIREIGSHTSDLERMHGRYVGLLKFSREGIQKLFHIYQNLILGTSRLSRKINGSIENAYMTDLLQEMIAQNICVQGYKIKGGWLEFDSAEDYARYQEWDARDLLKQFYDCNAN